jgi:hypothetical protein
MAETPQMTIHNSDRWMTSSAALPAELRTTGAGSA